MLATLFYVIYSTGLRALHSLSIQYDLFISIKPNRRFTSFYRDQDLGELLRQLHRSVRQIAGTILTNVMNSNYCLAFIVASVGSTLYIVLNGYFW